MAAPNYRVLDFNLGTVRDRERVVDPGTPYNAVTVLDIPAGASASLHFGTNKDAVPILGSDKSFLVSAEGSTPGCPVPPDEGLFLTNPGGAGTLFLLVSFSGVVLS